MILVGHSYGGVVITEAGTDPNVAGLVYITAFAPDKGGSVNTLIANPPPGASVQCPLTDGHPDPNAILDGIAPKCGAAPGWPAFLPAPGGSKGAVAGYGIPPDGPRALGPPLRVNRALVKNHNVHPALGRRSGRERARPNFAADKSRTCCR